MTRSLPTLRALASQRWLQFLVLGGGLFAFAPSSDDHHIALDSKVLAGLEIDHARRLGLEALDPEQARELQARVIEDEVLVREARRLGLDTDDAIIRARLVQKMLFLAEELDGASLVPSDAELRAYFDEHQSDYPLDGRATFVQVFARSQEQAAALREPVEAFSASQADPLAIPPLGEPMPISRRVDLSLTEIEQRYGPSFARALQEAPVGSWAGPMESAYGWHLVRVIERTEPRPARFEEVSGKVRLDALIARREAAVARFLTDAFRRYEVTIDGQPVALQPPTRRSAPRTQPSQED